MFLRIIWLYSLCRGSSLRCEHIRQRPLVFDDLIQQMRSVCNHEDDKAQAKLSEAVNSKYSGVECLTRSSCGGQESRQYISNMHSHEYLCKLQVVHF